MSSFQYSTHSEFITKHNGSKWQGFSYKFFFPKNIFWIEKPLMANIICVFVSSLIKAKGYWKYCFFESTVLDLFFKRKKCLNPWKAVKGTWVVNFKCTERFRQSFVAFLKTLNFTLTKSPSAFEIYQRIFDCFSSHGIKRFFSFEKQIQNGGLLKGQLVSEQI